MNKNNDLSGNNVYKWNNDLSGNYIKKWNNDISGNLAFFPKGLFNPDPNAKNYSNCDISGSFYAIHALDISGSVIKNEFFTR